jgi:sulfur transfer complex TusBCD TusB component (DsrH family)
VLVQHGSEVLHDMPRTFEAIKEYLIARTIEGVVWHHPDGRMVKIKRRDFVKSGPKRRT